MIAAPPITGSYAWLGWLLAGGGCVVALLLLVFLVRWLAR